MMAMLTHSDSPSDQQGEGSLSCVDIVEEDERWRSVPGLYPLIEAIAAKTLSVIDRKPEEHFVSIGLFADKDIQTLNREFRGKDEPTNVLSFPAAEMPGQLSAEDDLTFLGDVALGYETVAAEAAAEHKSVANHCAHLIVHGILHLAGFDHENDEDAEAMEKAERIVLATFDIADPYDPSTTHTN